MSKDAFGSNIEGAEAFVPQPAVIYTPPPRRDVNAASVDPRPRVRIVLEDNDQIPPHGQFIGIQGVGYLLKPNIEAEVPASVIDVLNNAVMSVPVIDPETRQVSSFRDRLRFPYRVIREINPRQAA